MFLVDNLSSKTSIEYRPGNDNQGRNFDGKSGGVKLSLNVGNIVNR